MYLKHIREGEMILLHLILPYSGFGQILEIYKSNYSDLNSLVGILISSYFDIFTNLYVLALQMWSRNQGDFRRDDLNHFPSLSTISGHWKWIQRSWSWNAHEYLPKHSLGPNKRGKDAIEYFWQPETELRLRTRKYNGHIS